MKKPRLDLPSDAYRPVQYTAVEGKVISKVYCTEGLWSSHSSGTRAPGPSRLFNFDLKVGAETFLVLDPYGNESFDAEMEARMFGGLPYDNAPGWVLAICRRSGHVYQMAFGQDGRKFVAVYWVFGGAYGAPNEEDFKVPPSFLSRLDELKGAKRPFNVSLRSEALLSYLTREYGFKDLRQNLVVRLDFNHEMLEVWGDSYREVGKWKNA